MKNVVIVLTSLVVITACTSRDNEDTPLELRNYCLKEKQMLISEINKGIELPFKNIKKDLDIVEDVFPIMNENSCLFLIRRKEGSPYFENRYIFDFFHLKVKDTEEPIIKDTITRKNNSNYPEDHERFENNILLLKKGINPY